jgi:hypothetical protein
MHSAQTRMVPVLSTVLNRHRGYKFNRTVAVAVEEMVG